MLQQNRTGSCCSHDVIASPTGGVAKRVWSLVLVVGGMTLIGCGGSSEQAATTATPGGGAAGVRQKIAHYSTEFDSAQTQRLFGRSASGADPADLVGRWEMQLNETLGILGLRAPDGGGPVFDIVENTDDTLVLEERDCRRPFVMSVERTSESLTLAHRSGGCKETVNLLVEESWRAQ